MSYRIKNGWKRYLRLGTAGIATVTAAFVWWCILYPELCFPEDTYALVQETEEEDIGFSEAENYYDLLHAEDEQIVIKSGLLEWIRQHRRE